MIYIYMYENKDQNNNRLFLQFESDFNNFWFKIEYIYSHDW